MRRVFWSMILCCAASSLGAYPSAAREYPFCIKGCDFGGGRGDCSFSSYQQCQAAGAGRVATCGANPYYSAKAELQPNRDRFSRRRY